MTNTQHKHACQWLLTIPFVLTSMVIEANSLLNNQGFCLYPNEEAFFAEWTTLSFPKIDKLTQYQWHKENDNDCYVHADANASASGLIYKTQLNLKNTPIIHWSWKVSNTLAKGDSLKKSGDDYAARIYIAFAERPEKLSWLDKVKRLSVELMYGQTLPGDVINYIWANKLPIGQAVKNPYVDQSIMISVQSGDTESSSWHHEERNVLEDYRRFFKKESTEVIGVAIMTDTDNTGESAQAWYGPIFFTVD